MAATNDRPAAMVSGPSSSSTMTINRNELPNRQPTKTTSAQSRRLISVTPQ